MNALHKYCFLRRSSSIFQLSRNVYRKTYTPPDEEIGNFPMLKKQIPEKGKRPFIYQIEEWIEKHLTPEEKQEPVNIGLPKPIYKYDFTGKKSEKQFKSKLNLELAALQQTLQVPLDDIQSHFEYSIGPEVVTIAAVHYGIFKDLFGNPHYFIPHLPMHILYDCVDEPDMVTPVYYGNHISPTECGTKPSVHICGPSNSHYTLLLTSLDSNIDADCPDNFNEVIHWLVSNIPAESVNSSASKGTDIVEYLPPIPPIGSGYHRLVFLLLHQTNGYLDDPASQLCLDFLKTKSPLQSRSFSTKEWYAAHQDEITPAGLTFFQTRWDSSVRSTYRNVLDIPEPSFEHLPKIELPEPEEEFPFAKSFNKYQDTYRDTKDIAEEVLLERLATSSLRGGPKEPRPPYPLAEYMSPARRDGGEQSEWYLDRMREKEMRHGYWNQLEPTLKTSEETDEQIWRELKTRS